MHTSRPTVRSAVVMAFGIAASMAVARPVRGQAQAPPGFVTEEVRVERSPGYLSGTLLVPASVSTPPLVIIIAGSGPTDRDGNSVGTLVRPNSLRLLAESLAVVGVASLRFDKRGVGGSRSSAIPESEMRFEMLASDVAAWIVRYTNDPRFTRVIVAGHSEGALLGLLALAEAPADGYVSIAGPARRADAVLHDQLAAQLPSPLLAAADNVLASLVAGRPFDTPPALLAALFRTSVQPYLISWLRYSGQTELAKYGGPCLIVQGSNDFQVLPAEATMLVAAQASCQLMLVDGMNHVLKRTPAPRAEQTKSYTDPALPLAPGLVDQIAEFVRHLPARR